MTSVAPDAGGFPATLTVELSDPNTYGLRERMWDARGLASVQLPLLPLLPLLVGGGDAGCLAQSGSTGELRCSATAAHAASFTWDAGSPTHIRSPNPTRI